MPIFAFVPFLVSVCSLSLLLSLPLPPLFFPLFFSLSLDMLAVSAYLYCLSFVLSGIHHFYVKNPPCSPSIPSHAMEVLALPVRFILIVHFLRALLVTKNYIIIHASCEEIEMS